MAHKVHPKAFRLKISEDWTSRWIERKNFAHLLWEDFVIREFLGKRLRESGVENIEIERFPGKTTVIVSSSRPGLIIGRKGSGVEELRTSLEVLLLKHRLGLPYEKRMRETTSRAGVPAKQTGSRLLPKREIQLEIREVKNIWSSASLTAQWIVQQIERRRPFRSVLKQGLSKIMSDKEVQGAKIQIAGRLGGAEIARTETLKTGRLPLQTLRARIDYALKEALTKYGIIGVKVWIYKGETFE